MKSEKETQSTIDPRDDVFGRSRVKDNEELIDFYKELEEFKMNNIMKNNTFKNKVLGLKV